MLARRVRSLSQVREVLDRLLRAISVRPQAEALAGPREPPRPHRNSPIEGMRQRQLGEIENR